MGERDDLPPTYFMRGFKRTGGRSVEGIASRDGVRSHKIDVDPMDEWVHLRDYESLRAQVAELEQRVAHLQADRNLLLRGVSFAFTEGMVAAGASGDDLILEKWKASTSVRELMRLDPSSGFYAGATAMTADLADARAEAKELRSLVNYALRMVSIKGHDAANPEMAVANVPLKAWRDFTERALRVEFREDAPEGEADV